MNFGKLSLLNTRVVCHRSDIVSYWIKTEAGDYHGWHQEGHPACILFASVSPQDRPSQVRLEERQFHWCMCVWSKDYNCFVKY